ncbi:MAG: hypothetical protein R2821_08450 [Flavobacteriaceae bacterium]
MKKTSEDHLMKSLIGTFSPIFSKAITGFPNILIKLVEYKPIRIATIINNKNAGANPPTNKKVLLSLLYSFKYNKIVNKDKKYPKFKNLPPDGIFAKKLATEKKSKLKANNLRLLKNNFIR